jgi:DNA transposition AAA+ family ATPase
MSTLQGPVIIKNVAAFMVMMTKLIGREPHLPGFGVCHAPSGYGKTWASIAAQNRTRAARIQVGDSWTRRTFLRAVLKEFGHRTKERASIAEMADLAIAAMGEDPRKPLIIDEADKMLDKGWIEIVRELQEASGAPIILIGEEQLPTKMLAVERMHNRVLDWMAAQPCDLEDTRELAKALTRVKIADDLLDAIRQNSGGRARRIVVNISQVNDFARNKGTQSVDLKLWGDGSFFTGAPPQPRQVEMFARPAKARAS